MTRETTNHKPHRFRPRFVALAFLSLSLGTILVVAAATLTQDTVSTVFSLVTGTFGLFLGFSYLRSPIWKLSVEATDDAITVWNGIDIRLRLPWEEVERVVVDEDRSTLYVDGGSAERSVLIPGPTRQASYIIKDKARLIQAILSCVPESKICSPAEASAAKAATVS